MSEMCNGHWREIEPSPRGSRRAVCTSCDATSAKAPPGKFDDGIHWLHDPVHWRYVAPKPPVSAP